MKSVLGREFVQTIERKGWVLLRIHGSHHVYGKEGSDMRLSVPVHGDRPLKIGLLHHLMKLAGLSEEDI